MKKYEVEHWEQERIWIKRNGIIIDWGTSENNAFSHEDLKIEEVENDDVED